MKKLLYFLPLAALATGCHNYQADIDKLKSDNQELAQSVQYKDSSIVSFLDEFNQIEGNLAAINEKEKVVAESTQNGELKKNQMDRINENIQDISQLMQDNKKRIANLSALLKKSNVKISGFEKMVANLNEQIGLKDKQLADLNNQVAEARANIDKLNTDVAQLTTDNNGKSEEIARQTQKIHTAYYTTGTFKELQSKHVVNKQGGFLGIGRTKSVLPNADKSNFNTIDITQTTVIPIGAKDASILTRHPSDSYKIEHKGDVVSDIQITDPDKFWQASKYLVVVVNK